jgi:lipopolysaccharide/colanic/teichoic acid biosynthesis glycosyltransferase
MSGVGVFVGGAGRSIAPIDGGAARRAVHPVSPAARDGLGRRLELATKRGLDLVAILAGGLLALPIILLAALAIKLADGGPVFYAQVRRGHRGQPIRVWKLRTMFEDAEQRLERHLAADASARAEWARGFKLRRDPRILPVVGHVLRCSSFDELPQLWNMLRGEMTLVGPRPLPDYHLAAFDAGFVHLRQSVLPGLTGLWQVSCRSNGDSAAFVRWDGEYVRNWSLLLDLKILLLTVLTVLVCKGAR